MTRYLFVLVLVLAACGGLCLPAHSETRIVMLGTGTPVPEPGRAGSSIAVVTGGEAYVFDAGGGAVLRAAEAAERYDMPELIPQNIAHLFVTHMHSDHLHDVAELATARWWSRERRLQIWGPAGIAQYVQRMNRMTETEAEIRVPGTPPELIVDPHGYRAAATEIEDGVVFESEHLTVEAFTVPHGDIRPAYGFAVTTSDRTIVISGDTAYSETVAERARGADVLLHEVISGDRLGEMSEFWQHYHGTSHTTTQELAELASRARPDLLILYHVLFAGATGEEILAEIRRGYDGRVVLAEDLDLF